MIKKTLYFGNPAYLSSKNKQLVIRLPSVEKSSTVCEAFKEKAVATIPIEDIGIVVLDHKCITITTTVLQLFLKNDVALLQCDDKSMPQGLFFPLYGNTRQTERHRQQLKSSAPLKKQLWAQTVRAKILNQAALLSHLHHTEIRGMSNWANEVRSGDPDNMEARAAVYYWKNLFPSLPHFVREREGQFPNLLLNYGYAILRAIVARALVISGMLPSWGIFHSNKYNPFCLADDIMEPYRPYVDLLVYHMLEEGCTQLDKEAKARLLDIPILDVFITEKRRPLMTAVSQTTASLFKCFNIERRLIDYPDMTHQIL